MCPRPRFLSLPAERRRAILGAACAELSVHGFEKASTNRIIERAGVSKGALYYYFDDKRDLFLTTLRDATERGFEAVGPPREAHDASGFWDALLEWYERITLFVAREPALAGLIQATLSPSAGPGVAALVDEYSARCRRYLRGLLARGIELGAVRDDLPLDLLSDLVLATGESHDRWALEHWDELVRNAPTTMARRLLELHIRLAAPLDLVCAREGGSA